MLFGHKTHPLNFDYGVTMAILDDGVQVRGRSFWLRLLCDDIAPGVARLRFENSYTTDRRQHSDGIEAQYRQGRRRLPQRYPGISWTTAAGTIAVTTTRLRLKLNSGMELETAADGFGCLGEKLILDFQLDGVVGCYGCGERTRRLNKRGDSLDFWNVDVVAIFRHHCDRDDYDPAYVAVPFAILKRGEQYCGLFFDNPGRAVLDVAATFPGRMYYQSLAGDTDVYVIDGPSLREVVRRFTDLTGRAPLPPLWSLGYHQCRWGYKTAAEFRALKHSFREYDIPVSALWFDIDYMDGFRLFTWNPATFPEPAALVEELHQAGICAVTIVDPGVKRESGYAVYDGGAGLWCRTAAGKDYVGRVWPGDTVFPDFTLEKTRHWWAEQLAAFLQASGVDGVWLDMNDPATGFSTDDDMRFQEGSVPHDRYHNQYGHFMAKASRAAWAEYAPDRRPFLLTRSGCTGTQRYSAVWTGDNASNWAHLRMAIPETLNLGLSGIACSGPDVGGFLGHTTAELLVRWYQTCFLFPFFRNHSVRDCRPQEPWQFGPQYLALIRAAIRTRYRLLPYLYTLFFEHYLTADPILRPMCYDFESPLFNDLDDQFMVGDGLLMAPILAGDGQGRVVVRDGKSCQLRHVILPAGGWFDLNRGEWLDGGRTLSYAAELDEVPLFARDGALLPYYQGPLQNDPPSLAMLELHIFSRTQPARLRYFIDDRETEAYQRGAYNVVDITANLTGDELRVQLHEQGTYPPDTVTFRPVLYGVAGERRVVIDRNGTVTQTTLRPEGREWLSRVIPVLAGG